jgi:hypothetical protein
MDRKLNTGDSKDKVLTIGSSFNIGYAWGKSDDFVDHKNLVG